jgi:hypothetical protein
MLEARNSDLRLLIVGSKGHGYPSKMYEYYGMLSSDTWSQTTVTWDGNEQDLLLYQDGALHAPSGTILNDRWLAMTDSVDKSLWLGENKDTFSREFSGRIHSAAIWNTVLPASRIVTITGAATEDLSDAKHWWRLGLEATTSGLGLDYGSSSTSIDVNQASSQITADDVVDDYPGMPAFFYYTYSSSQDNVNFFTDAGSPSFGNWVIVIEAGVTLGSADVSTPAAVTGSFPGTLTVVNSGRIQGQGGDGGAGRGFVAGGKGTDWHSGGGGGGAGTGYGLGGESGTGTGVDGADGTSEDGGAGGIAGTNPGGVHDHAAVAGENAGHALQLEMDVTVDNTGGEIWGGGGGGSGGDGAGAFGGSGGDPGEAGSVGLNGPSAGAAGKAVDLQGNSITWDGGEGSPNVKGAVS